MMPKLIIVIFFLLRCINLQGQEQKKERSINGIWSSAISKVRSRNYPAAIELLSEFIKSSPSNDSAYSLRAYCLIESKDFRSANLDCQKALSLNPNSIEAFFILGKVALEEKENVKAAAIFGKILNKKPNYEPAWARYNLGLALYCMQEFNNASKYFHESLELFNKPIDPFVYLMVADNEVAQGNHLKAISVLRKALIDYPENGWVWNNLGASLATAGLLESAAESFRRAYLIVYSINQVPSHRTSLVLPFQGKWVVRAGNGIDPSDIQNHRGIVSRFAWDFSMVNSNLERYIGRGTENKDYIGFGGRVVAAAGGVIVEAVDCIPDNVPGVRNTYPMHQSGNYVVIRHDIGEYTLYAHLKKNSVCVRLGEDVHQGSLIGLCGNSGNTNEPHLHFSLIDSFGKSAISRPAKFSNYWILCNGQRVANDIGIPRNGEVIQSCVDINNDTR